MTNANDDDNWLHVAQIVCSSCGLKLIRGDHSPFLDDYRLYCSSCPRAIEISLYDPVLADIQKRLPEDAPHIKLMAAIEPHLRPCKCGGHFLAASIRRCFNCNTGIIVDDPDGVDLHPEFGGEVDIRDYTPEENIAYERFVVEYIERENLWLKDRKD